MKMVHNPQTSCLPQPALARDAGTTSLDARFPSITNSNRRNGSLLYRFTVHNRGEGCVFFAAARESQRRKGAPRTRTRLRPRAVFHDAIRSRLHIPTLPEQARFCVAEPILRVASGSSPACNVLHLHPQSLRSYMASTQLQSFVDGVDSGPTIIFVHGWPDDHTLFDKQVEVERSGFVCQRTAAVVVYQHKLSRTTVVESLHESTFGRLAPHRRSLNQGMKIVYPDEAICQHHQMFR